MGEPDPRPMKRRLLAEEDFPLSQGDNRSPWGSRPGLDGEPTSCVSDPISLQFGFMCFEMMQSLHQHSIPPGTLMTNFRSFKDVILFFDQTPLSLSFSKLIHIFYTSLVDALRHQKLSQSSICHEICFMLCLLLYQDSHHPEVCPVLSFPLPCVPAFCFVSFVAF